jgi:hypothetical protein
MVTNECPHGVRDSITCRVCHPGNVYIEADAAPSKPPASQDAEILRLRGAINALTDYWADWWGGGRYEDCTDQREIECKKLVRAALSSPAPQDDVIVPRADLTELYNMASNTFGSECTIARKLRALLKD